MHRKLSIMLKQITTLFIAASSLTLSTAHAADTHTHTHSKTPTKEMKADSYRHVVLFNFKDSATKEQIQEVISAFKALPTKIKEIKGFEWGTQTSPEGLTLGMTHSFLVTFDDAAGLDVYLPHPEHKKFVALVSPLLEGKPIVADYIAQDSYKSEK